MKTAVILASLAVLSAPLYAESELDILKKAHKGNVAAMRQIGYMKVQGKGAKKDIKNGLAWLKKAAEEGDAQAMYYLGNMYARGLYVKKDMEEAEKYLSAASEKGYKKATKELALLASTGDKGDTASQPRKMTKVSKDAVSVDGKGEKSGSETRDIAKGDIDAQLQYASARFAANDESQCTKAFKAAYELDPDKTIKAVKKLPPENELTLKVWDQLMYGKSRNAMGKRVVSFDRKQMVAGVRTLPKQEKMAPLMLKIYSRIIKIDNAERKDHIEEKDVEPMLYACTVVRDDENIFSQLEADFERVIKKVYLFDSDKVLAVLDTLPGEKTDKMLRNLLSDGSPSGEKAQKDINVQLRYASIQFAANIAGLCKDAFSAAYELDPDKTIEAVKKLPLENELTLTVWEALICARSRYTKENLDRGHVVAGVRTLPREEKMAPLMLKLYSRIIKADYVEEEKDHIEEKDVDLMLYACKVVQADENLLSQLENDFERVIKKIYLFDNDKALAVLDAIPGEKAKKMLGNLLNSGSSSSEKAQKDINVQLRYASTRFEENDKSNCTSAYRRAYKLDPAKTIEVVKELPQENELTLAVWETLISEKCPEAAMALGLAYTTGSAGLKADTHRAEGYFDKVVEFGSSSHIKALPTEKTFPFWVYLADKKENQYAALRLIELYLTGADGIPADEKKAQGYFYKAYMWSPKAAEEYVAKLDASKAGKLKPALKEILLTNEQNKLLCERAFMVDKSLPFGALIGDYKERFDNNLSRAKDLGVYSPEKKIQGNELLNLVNNEMIPFGSLFCLYYAAVKHRDLLPADAGEKIAAIYNDIREYHVYENIYYDDDLRRIENAAYKLGEELFGADFGRDAMKKEAAINSFGYVMDMISVQVLRYNMSKSLYQKSNLGAMLKNLLLDRYEEYYMEWKFKWKVYSLADVFGGDVQLIDSLQKASNSQFQSYRSKLLSALKSKYHPSEAFLQHVSDTLDLLRSNDQLDKYLIANYMSNFTTSTHYFSFWSPSLGQMCGIDL